MNVNFVKYEAITGRILWAGSTQEIALQNESNVLIVDQPIDATLYRVVNGNIVELPPKPHKHYKFDYQNEIWIPDPDRAWSEIREWRNIFLSDCDWTQTSDNALTAEKKQEWQTYRQALRDITNQPDPFTIIWPTPPGA